MYENLFPHSLIKQEELETKSFSSHDSFKQKHAFMVKDLYSNVTKQLKKNEQKLLQIIKENPHFNFDLYRPSLLAKGQSKQNLNSELLQKQLDRLMEDQCKLDKQLSKIQFKNQQDQLLKQIQTNQRIDHFSFLRNVWHRSEKQAFANSEDQLQQLNRKVVMIRGSIKSLRQKEKQKIPESIQLQKYIEQSKQFLELQQKYQRKAGQWQNKQQEYNMQIQQLSAKISSLREENCNMCRKFGEETEKIKKKDDQLLKIMDKCQALELQIIRKQKEIKKLLTGNTCIQDVSMKSLVNLNPETNNKKLTYLNKNQDFSLHIVFQSDTTSAEINNFSTILSTGRNFNEIKNYLASNNNLQGLIQNKYVSKFSSSQATLPTTFLKTNLSSTLEKRMESRRVSNFEKPQILRSQNLLGSADKRKRFQRTKTLESQDLT